MVKRSHYNRLSLNLNIYQDRAVEGNRNKFHNLSLLYVSHNQQRIFGK